MLYKYLIIETVYIYLSIIIIIITITITIIIIITKGDQIAFINDREKNVVRAAGVVISVISFIFVCFVLPAL